MARESLDEARLPSSEPAMHHFFRMNAYMQMSLQDFEKTHEHTKTDASKNLKNIKDFIGATRGTTKLPAHLSAIASLCLSQTCPPSDPTLGVRVAKKLAECAKDALGELRQAQDNTSACLDPRREAELLLDIRLCFFLLCHLAMATSKLANELHASKSGADRMANSSKAVLLAAWQLHSIVLPTIFYTEDYISSCSSTLGASEVRAASSLLQVAILGVVEYPLPPVPSKGAQEEADRVHQTVAGYLVKVLSPGTTSQETTAVRVFESLAMILEAPRKSGPPPVDVLHAFNNLLQSAPRAGASMVAAMVQRLGGNPAQEGQRAAGSTSPGSVPDHLAGFLSALAASNKGQTARACFLASFTEILLLLGHTRPGVRRPVLDIVVELSLVHPTAPNGVQPSTSSPSTLFLAGVSAVLSIASNDKDATLRARALGIIETHAPAIVQTLGAAVDSAKSLTACIASGLCDRSVSVRRRAGQLLVALCVSNAPAPTALQQVLKATITPILTSLLKVAKDSTLYPGEDFTAQLTTCLMAIDKPAGSPAAALAALRLHLCATEDAGRAVIEKTLASALLPANSTGYEQDTAPLLSLLKVCSRRDVEHARGVLQGAIAGVTILQGRAARTVAALMGSLGIGSASTSSSVQNKKHLLPALQGIFILGYSSNTSFAGMPSPIVMCAHLLALTKAITSSSPADGPTCETLHWALQCTTSALKQLKPIDWDAGMTRLVISALQVVAAVPWAKAELPTAARMLFFLPSPRQAFEHVVSILAAEAIAAPFTPHRDSALMTVLGVMSRLYLAEKEEFRKTLDAGGEPAKVASAGGGPSGAGAGAGGGGDTSQKGDGAYLQGEEHAQRVELACQAFLDRVIQSQQSSPACFIPWLLSAAAVQALQPMAMMCYKLCCDCMPLVASQATSVYTFTETRIAAINFLAVAIATFPTAFSNHLSTLTSVLATPRQSPSNIDSKVTAVALTAFAHLALSNKLKGSDVLASVGVVVSSADANTSRVGLEVLRRLMEGASPADRAMLFMGVLHQIPHDGTARQVAVVAAVELLNDADKKNDALVAPAVALALEASSDDAACAAAALLHHLQPSAKTLRSLQASLQGATLAGMHESVRQELVRFVQGSALQEDKENEYPDGAVDGGESGGRKRPRQVGSGKKRTAALQEVLRTLLQENEGQRRRRQPVAPADGAPCPS